MKFITFLCVYLHDRACIHNIRFFLGNLQSKILAHLSKLNVVQNVIHTWL